jgi:2-keto-4-pentenoate hydratase/2-oxohepta-3-ene-1,7-dioic acid hydratase in catechol pathway
VRLCRFATDGGDPALGVVESDTVIDLSSTAAPAEPAAALDELGREGLAALATNAPRLSLAEVRLLAPATPRKYLAIALNYADHIAELGMDAPRCRSSSTSR